MKLPDLSTQLASPLPAPLHQWEGCIKDNPAMIRLYKWKMVTNIGDHLKSRVILDSRKYGKLVLKVHGGGERERKGKNKKIKSYQVTKMTN